MTYIALRDFDKFKKGDLIPNEVVEDRLIRGRKIGLVDSKVEIKEDKIIISEVVQEEPEVREVKLQLLIEDSSDVTVQEEQEELEVTPESEKTSKKKK